MGESARSALQRLWDRDQPRVRRSFFRTGDVGYQDVKGYFYILDRQKDMIVTGGENVYCGEVEAVILVRVVAPPLYNPNNFAANPINMFGGHQSKPCSAGRREAVPNGSLPP